MTLILIGALIVVVGGIVGAIGTFKHNRTSSEKSTKTLTGVTKTGEDVTKLKEQNLQLVKKADTLQEKVDNQSLTIDDLRRENTDLHAKLANKALEIYNNITGGDSYCKMEVSVTNGTTDIGNLVFSLMGKYPLNNVQARLVDLNYFGKNPFTINEIFKDIINIGVLEPGKALYTTNQIKLDRIKGVNLNVFFTANNGFYTQAIRMKYHNNNWITASVISSDKDGKQLYKKIDSNYPEKDEKLIFR